MSDRPRRRPVPTIKPASFDDERPTPVTSTKTTMDPMKAPLPPEPPTIPAAISITAPRFQEAAKAGPPKPKREREGDARTVAGRAGPLPSVTPAQPPRRLVGDQETRTEISGLGAEPSASAPAAAPPQAPRRGRPEPETKPTEMSDPWEYRGEVAEQAASLGSDYEGGGVELDAAGRLVAPGPPGMNRRARKPDESNPGVAPADLLSVGLEMWPEAPPPKPQASLPRVEPVIPMPPAEPEPPTGPPQRELPRRELSPEPPTGPPQRRASAPEDVPTLPPRRSASRAGPMRSPVATADTVLRAPRGPAELEEDDAGVEPTRVKGMAGELPQDELIQDEPRYGEAGYDEPRYGEPGYEEPAGDVPQAEDERFDEAPYDDEVSGRRPIPAEETRVKGGALDEPTSRRNRRLLLRDQERPSRWPGALLTILLLGLAGAGAWLWYTGQLTGLLPDFRRR